MMRIIVSPAALTPDALAELQDWLGITTQADASELTKLLTVALGVCADFTGLLPLQCGCQETLPLPADWLLVPPPPACLPLPSPLDWRYGGVPPGLLPPGKAPGYVELASRPVQSVSAVAGLDNSGNLTAFDPSIYQVWIDAEGGCRISVSNPGSFYRCQVSFTAGLAASWDQIPDPLRHGIIQLAAYQYRSRDAAGAGPLPPAAVSALWLPWRRARLI